MLRAAVHELGDLIDREHDRAPHAEADERKIFARKPVHRCLFTSMYTPTAQITMEPDTFHTVQGRVTFPVTARSRVEDTSHRIPHSRRASATCSIQITAVRRESLI